MTIKELNIGSGGSVRVSSWQQYQVQVLSIVILGLL